MGKGGSIPIGIPTMRIAIGSDHRGVAMRKSIIDLIVHLRHEVVDFGTDHEGAVDYPDIAAMVGREIMSGRVHRGVLICGTGLGVCVAANKFPGVRAAPCHDEFLAEMSRRHLDVNVLCLSADMLGVQIGLRIAQRWLETEFDGGRHARRVEKITAMENARGISANMEGRTSPRHSA
jgi:ribose 5-phosphate isomerase B